MWNGFMWVKIHSLHVLSQAPHCSPESKCPVMDLRYWTWDTGRVAWLIFSITGFYHQHILALSCSLVGCVSPGGTLSFLSTIWEATLTRKLSNVHSFQQCTRVLCLYTIFNIDYSGYNETHFCRWCKILLFFNLYFLKWIVMINISLHISNSRHLYVY